MTKQLLLPAVLLVLLHASALAQNAKPPKPPHYCNPCLFYGGDYSNIQNAQGISNEKDLLVADSQVLVPFDVPKTQRWDAIGLFTNDVSTVGLIDPAQAVWSISTDVTQGSCGTALASGNSRATFKPTGRSEFGLNEYTTLVKIKTVHLKPRRYWLATVPECTNTNDSSCGSARYFASEFSGKPLHPFGPPEPCNLSYFTSKTFGQNCTLITGKGCNRSSAGVLGTKKAGNTLLDEDGN
jgi:hypothetical protein